MPNPPLRIFATSLLTAVSIGTLTAPVIAQEIRDLDSETSNVRSFSGRVGSEPTTFAVTVPAGELLRVEAISTSTLDPYLTISDAGTGAVLLEDDDGGDELNARIVLPVAVTERRITIAVSQFTSDLIEAETSGGSFNLRLTSFIPAPATPISWDESVAGTIDAGGTAEYSFAGEAGIILDVALMAEGESGFDPFLRLLDSAGEELASDDDGGEGLNSQLRYLMQDTGPFTIVASSYGEEAGAFTLRVGDRREPIAQLPLQVIGIADTATGRLGAGYDNGGIDPASIEYQFSEAAIAAIQGGQHEVTIRMNAASESDFGSTLDPYLELGFDTPLGFATVDSDDDSGGELNAMLPLDLAGVAEDEPMLRSLRIRAQALAGSAGDYTLVITEGMEIRAAVMPAMIPPPAPPAPVRVVPSE